MSNLEDNRGSVIEVGKLVCYNFSGQLAIGIIEKINKARYSGYTFHIKRLHPKADHTWQKSDVSKVKDSKSIMVLFEPKPEGSEVIKGVEASSSKLVTWLRDGGND